MNTSVLFAAKGHVAAIIALVTTLVAAVAPYGAFNEDTAVPIIIALAGAFLVWLTPRATSGALAYSKLGVAILTAAAQVVVPAVFTDSFGWASVPVVALAIFSAYKVWETPDAKSEVANVTTLAEGNNENNAWYTLSQDTAVQDDTKYVFVPNDPEVASHSADK